MDPGNHPAWPYFAKLYLPSDAGTEPSHLMSEGIGSGRLATWSALRAVHPYVRLAVDKLEEWRELDRLHRVKASLLEAKVSPQQCRVLVKQGPPGVCCL